MSECRYPKLITLGGEVLSVEEAESLTSTNENVLRLLEEIKKHNNEYAKDVRKMP